YESFNAVQRQAAVHTNRGAPSKDIASRIATQETVAHWASGGVVWASEDNQLAQPGPQIEPLLNDPTVKSLRSKWLPTEDDMQEPGIVIRSEAPLLYLTDLDIIGEGRGLPAFLPAERFHNGTAIVSQAGEKCKAGDFVSIHAQSTGTRRENVYDFTVGRLVGIFLSSGAANTPLVRLELFKIKEKSKYGMAGLVGDGTHALFEGKSAENAGAVLSINLKTGDVATKLLLTVRERTMEIYGRAISKTISGKASMFGCTPADTMSSGKKTQSKGYLIAFQPSSVLGLELAVLYPLVRVHRRLQLVCVLTQSSVHRIPCSASVGRFAVDRSDPRLRIYISCCGIALGTDY
ncbi:unnamed protein product, partial [Tilletia caries]